MSKTFTTLSTLLFLSYLASAAPLPEALLSGLLGHGHRPPSSGAGLGLVDVLDNDYHKGTGMGRPSSLGLGGLLKRSLLGPLNDALAPIAPIDPVLDTASTSFLEPVTGPLSPALQPLAILGVDVDLLTPTDLLCARVAGEFVNKAYALGCVCLGQDGLLLTADAGVEVIDGLIDWITAEVNLSGFHSMYPEYGVPTCDRNPEDDGGEFRCPLGKERKANGKCAAIFLAQTPTPSDDSTPAVTPAEAGPTPPPTSSPSPAVDAQAASSPTPTPTPAPAPVTNNFNDSPIDANSASAPEDGGMGDGQGEGEWVQVTSTTSTETVTIPATAYIQMQTMTVTETTTMTSTSTVTSTSTSTSTSTVTQTQTQTVDNCQQTFAAAAAQNAAPAPTANSNSGNSGNNYPAPAVAPAPAANDGTPAPAPAYTPAGVTPSSDTPTSPEDDAFRPNGAQLLGRPRPHFDCPEGQVMGSTMCCPVDKIERNGECACKDGFQNLLDLCVEICLPPLSLVGTKCLNLDLGVGDLTDSLGLGSTSGLVDGLTGGLLGNGAGILGGGNTPLSGLGLGGNSAGPLGGLGLGNGNGGGLGGLGLL